jgi:hypothetical protein
MHQRAKEPQDLAKFFIERANAGDIEGLVALYETTATLSCGVGNMAIGEQQIRKFYTSLLSSRPRFTPGVQAPALRNGDIALTSSRLCNGDITAEIARQQPDGNWLWTVDQPAIGNAGTSCLMNATPNTQEAP